MALMQRLCLSCHSGNAALTLRSRLRCIVMKKESQDSQVTKPATNLLVLNEVRIMLDLLPQSMF